MPVYKDGQPLLLGPAQVPHYFELIGGNSEYVIHPEEVLADNFTIMIQEGEAMAGPSFMEEVSAGDSRASTRANSALPNPEIVEHMRRVLVR